MSNQPVSAEPTVKEVIEIIEAAHALLAEPSVSRAFKQVSMLGFAEQIASRCAGVILAALRAQLPPAVTVTPVDRDKLRRDANLLDSLRDLME